MKLKDSNCDENPKLKWCQNSKSERVTKQKIQIVRKNSNFDSETQIVTKLKNSKCDKIQNSNCDKYCIMTNLNLGERKKTLIGSFS